MQTVASRDLAPSVGHGEVQSSHDMLDVDCLAMVYPDDDGGNEPGDGLSHVCVLPPKGLTSPAGGAGQRQKNARLLDECEEYGPSKGLWTPEQDIALKRAVESFNSSTLKKYGCLKHLPWSIISQRVGNRDKKQCRERWTNHLRPGIRKEAWTEEEDARLIELVQTEGTRWAKLMKDTVLMGRTDNALKNRWSTLKPTGRKGRMLWETKNLVLPTTTSSPNGDTLESDLANLSPTMRSVLSTPLEEWDKSTIHLLSPLATDQIAVEAIPVGKDTNAPSTDVRPKKRKLCTTGRTIPEQFAAQKRRNVSNMDATTGCMSTERCLSPPRFCLEDIDSDVNMDQLAAIFQLPEDLYDDSDLYCFEALVETDRLTATAPSVHARTGATIPATTPLCRGRGKSYRRIDVVSAAGHKRATSIKRTMRAINLAQKSFSASISDVQVQSSRVENGLVYPTPQWWPKDMSWESKVFCSPHASLHRVLCAYPY